MSPSLDARCVCGEEYGDHRGKIGRCPDSTENVFRPAPTKELAPRILREKWPQRLRHQVVLRFDDAQYQALKDLAALNLLSMAGYLRQLLRREQGLPHVNLRRK